MLILGRKWLLVQALIYGITLLEKQRIQQEVIDPKFKGIHLLQFNKLEETKEKVNKSVKTHSAHIEDKDSSLNEIEQSPTSRLRNLLNKKSKTANYLSDFNKECST